MVLELVSVFAIHSWWSQCTEDIDAPLSCCLEVSWVVDAGGNATLTSNNKHIQTAALTSNLSLSAAVFIIFWWLTSHFLHTPACYPVNLKATLLQCKVKSKGLPKQAEVAQGVPGRLRPRIFLTFGTTRVVVCQPYGPAVFTPGEIPGTHF
jgi:hypothetical protein